MRHAETRANLERVLAGRSADQPLTEAGERQASAVAEWLAANATIRQAYASPLARAAQTASTIASRLCVPLALDEALAEMHVGQLDGRGDALAWAEHDAVVARWWQQDDWDAAFPGGENYRQIFSRFNGFLTRVAEQHTGDDVVAVSHGGLIASVLPRLCAIPNVAGQQTLWLANTAVTELVLEDGAWRCERWNGRDHLLDPAG